MYIFVISYLFIVHIYLYMHKNTFKNIHTFEKLVVLCPPLAALETPYVSANS